MDRPRADRLKKDFLVPRPQEGSWSQIGDKGLGQWWRTHKKAVELWERLSDRLGNYPSGLFCLYRLISDYTVTKDFPKTDTLLFSRTIDPWALCEIINVTVDTLYFLIIDLFLNLDLTIN